MTTSDPTTATRPIAIAEIERLRAAGVQAARTVRVVKSTGAWLKPMELRGRQAKAKISWTINETAIEDRLWLADNLRLIRTSQKDTRSIARSLRYDPANVDEAGVEAPRVYRIAGQYLSAAMDAFSEEGLAAFLSGYQQTFELEMGEIWALKPSLQFATLERIANARPASWPALITSLRHIGEASWKDLFESVSVVDNVLARDSGYFAMDYESRDLYRNVIAELAKHSNRSERHVAGTALQLAAARAGRQGHVGYFLIDEGLAELAPGSGTVKRRCSAFAIRCLPTPTPTT
ncbi:MAG: hypothetical protein WKF37_09675 [Bryobacteraceae bacterium]